LLALPPERVQRIGVAEIVCAQAEHVDALVQDAAWKCAIWLDGSAEPLAKMSFDVLEDHNVHRAPFAGARMHEWACLDGMGKIDTIPLLTSIDGRAPPVSPKPSLGESLRVHGHWVLLPVEHFTSVDRSRKGSAERRP